MWITHCGPAILSHLLGIVLEALRGSRHYHPIVLAAITRLAYTHAFFLATWTVRASLPEGRTGPFTVLTPHSLRRWLPPPPASYYTSTKFDSLPLSSAWVPGCAASLVLRLRLEATRSALASVKQGFS